MQVTEALKANRYMRVLYDRKGGDFIAWPGDEGLHDDIMKNLNLSDDTADNLGTIRSYEDLKRLVDWVECEY